jgi:uncharacterized protein YbjT (DUF2867 family)
MIVITTPTGQIGRQVIDRLLGTREMIRVIARDPSTAITGRPASCPPRWRWTA